MLITLKTCHPSVKGDDIHNYYFDMLASKIRSRLYWEWNPSSKFRL